MKSELLDEARRLTLDERIDLVEAIWDTIPENADRDQLAVPEAHREELDRRLDAMREHPEASRPWGEVRARLERDP